MRQTRREEVAPRRLDGGGLDDNAGIDTAALVRKRLVRPVQMLVFDSMCIAMCVVISYASAIYCESSVSRSASLEDRITSDKANLISSSSKAIQ